MANALYPLWKEQILQGTASALLTGTGATGVYASLLTASYVYNAAHQFYTSWIASPDAVLSTDQEVGSHTYTTGTFSGANVTYTTVTGAVVTAIGMYVKNAGANTTWRLLSYLDTSVTGLPLTPNGGNITITWNASGIFTLSDKRAKHDLKAVGELIGVGTIYGYAYNGAEGVRCRGLLAQEVERRVPAAVIEFKGRKMVNYRRILQHIAA